MKLTKAETRILEILLKEGRLSFREVAKKTGLTTPTISAKVSMFQQMGVIKGFSVILDAESLDEITILVTGHLKEGEEEGERLALSRNVREMYLLGGGRFFSKMTFVSWKELTDFLSSMEGWENVKDIHYEIIVKTIKEEARALLSEDMNAVLKCFYCRKTIEGEPIKMKLEGRDHFFCCPICKREYKEKYDRLASRRKKSGENYNEKGTGP